MRWLLSARYGCIEFGVRPSWTPRCGELTSGLDNDKNLGLTHHDDCAMPSRRIPSSSLPNHLRSILSNSIALFFLLSPVMSFGQSHYVPSPSSSPPAPFVCAPPDGQLLPSPPLSASAERFRKQDLVCIIIIPVPRILRTNFSSRTSAILRTSSITHATSP